MLYGKIYLDTVDGREAIVFNSLKVDVGQKYEAEYVDNIAICQEARELLSMRLKHDHPKLKVERFFGDFELTGGSDWEHGSFHFKPETEENGVLIRTLREDDVLVLSLKHGIKLDGIDYMIPCDNDYLKTLDLHDSIDPAMLWERHFAAMVERGEEPATDTETIKKTPAKYLTAAQKSIIKQHYRHRLDSYDSQEWHDHGDFLLEKILGEITTCYRKSWREIKSICGITY